MVVHGCTVHWCTLHSRLFFFGMRADGGPLRRRSQAARPRTSA